MGKARIGFVGCVKEGRECLEELIDAGGNVVGVFTFTDEMARKTSGAVDFEKLANQHDTPLFKINNTNTPETAELIKSVRPDVVFVIGWTRLVSAEILSVPKLGCIGMHASMLPKYRGRAPVNWAIINGETKTANTMILLDDGVDTGDILLQKPIDINFSDTCYTVYEKVASAGREMISEILSSIDSGCLSGEKQDDNLASLMPKRTPADGLIDWHKTSMKIYNWVRAQTHPYPGAFTYWNHKKIQIWGAHPQHYSAPGMDEQTQYCYEPGEVVSVSDGITVATGTNELLTIRQLNFENEPELNWRDFLSQHSLFKGQKFEGK